MTDEERLREEIGNAAKFAAWEAASAIAAAARYEFRRAFWHGASASAYGFACVYGESALWWHGFKR